MDFWIKFIAVFCAVTATDACWTLYIIRVAEKKALEASSWASIISLMTSFTVIAYTENHYFIIATVLGAFVGTLLAIKIIKK